jgi:alpha-L-fucosidase
MPSVIINDRIDVGLPKEPPMGYRRAGDYTTPELTVPENGLPGQDWETCMTMNKNWGYAKDDSDWKPLPELLALLVGTASRGGNLLLNVGPDGDGRIPRESLDGLRGMGAWLRTNGRAIYGTKATPFERGVIMEHTGARAPVRVTRTDRTVNLFLAERPEGSLLLPGVRQTPRSATVLGAGNARVAWKRTPAGLSVACGDPGPQAIMPVVQLRFDSTLRIAE